MGTGTHTQVPVPMTRSRMTRQNNPPRSTTAARGIDILADFTRGHLDLSPEVGADLRYQALLYPAVDDGLHNRRLTIGDAGHKGHKGVRGTCVSFFSPFNSALRVSISPPE